MGAARRCAGPAASAQPTPDWTARLLRPFKRLAGRSPPASRDRPESPPSPTPTTLRGPLRRRTFSTGVAPDSLHQSTSPPLIRPPSLSPSPPPNPQTSIFLSLQHRRYRYHPRRRLSSIPPTEPPNRAPPFPPTDTDTDVRGTVVGLPMLHAERHRSVPAHR